MSKYICNIRRIKNTHTDVNLGSYKCFQCNKHMSIKTSLKRHMRVHLGVKSQPCVHCKKSLIDKADLLKHIKIHTGTKNHKCKLCDNTFLTPKLLSLHQRIHSEEKSFGRNLCEKVLSCAKSVKEHISRVHEINTLHYGASKELGKSRFAKSAQK